MKKAIVAQKLKSLFQISWLQVAYLVVNTGFVSILYIYFVKNHLNFGYIILAEALGYAASVFFILIKKQFSSRRDIQIGFVMVIVGMVSLFLPLAPLALLIIYTVLRLSGGIIFFVPYNILFFGTTESDKKMHKMATYWAIVSLVGILAPVVGGYIFSQWGMNIFLGVALAILGAALLISFKLKKEVYTYSIKEILRHLKGTRTITMFDGALQIASQLIITLYLLTFIQDEFSFGRILSINALFSVFFSLKVAKFSDRSNKRIELIWPLSFASAAIMVLLYFVNSFWEVIVLIIMFKFITTLFNPVRANIVLDKSDNSAITWVSRELYLNIGRAIVLFFLAIVLYFGVLKESFLVLGFIFAALPLVIFLKRIYAK